MCLSLALQVIALCKNTGYYPGQPKPKNYPEELFSRFPVPAEITQLIIARLQSDDIYLAVISHINLKPQYLSLFSFVDKVLSVSWPAKHCTWQPSLYAVCHLILQSTDFAGANDHYAWNCGVFPFEANIWLDGRVTYMSFFQDRHFDDNWILPIYMGWLVDLRYYPSSIAPWWHPPPDLFCARSDAWYAYPAAAQALKNTLNVQQVSLYLVHIRCEFIFYFYRLYCFVFHCLNFNISRRIRYEWPASVWKNWIHISRKEC
jgi:hypothetical protein